MARHGTGSADSPMSPSLGDVAARGTKVTLLTQLLRFLLLITALVVLARLLSPADFGIVAMVTSIIGVAEIIRDFGLATAAVQSRTLSDDERTNLFWANVAIGTACAGVAVLGIPLIVGLYDEPQLRAIILTLSGVFILNGATTQFQAELTRSLRFKALAGADILAQAAGIAVAIGMALLDFNYWAIVGQQITVSVLTLTLMATISRWRPGLPRRAIPIGKFFRFGGGVFGTQLIGYLTRNVDNVAIGAYYGAGPLGLYTRAYQLLMTPLNQLNAPMTRIALPVLSRVQDDDETYGRYLAKSQLFGCYLTATLFAVSAGLAVPLVDILFGPRWAEVAPIFAILAMGGVFRAMDQLAYWIYLSRGHTGAQLRLFLITGPLMTVIILAGLPWGPVGVAAGCSVAYTLHWALSLWYVGRKAKIDSAALVRTAARSVLTVSLPCGLLAFGAARLVHGSIAQLALGMLAVAAYVAAAVTLIPPVRRDAHIILDVVRRAFRR